MQGCLCYSGVTLCGLVSKGEKGNTQLNNKGPPWQLSVEFLLIRIKTEVEKDELERRLCSLIMVIDFVSMLGKTSVFFDELLY